MHPLLKKVGFFLALALVGAAVARHNGEALSVAQAQVQEAREFADSAVAVAYQEMKWAEQREIEAEALSLAANAAAARATDAEKAFIRKRAELNAVASAASDLCSTVVAAADSAVIAADSAVNHWKAAHDLRAAEAAKLAAALDSTQKAQETTRGALRKLDNATGELVKATKRSFLSRLTPQPGVGVAAGVDALGRPNTVIGVTLGWRF